MQRFVGLVAFLAVLAAVSTTDANDKPNAQLATGIVFEDRNANGKHDDGEPGIAGVAVSNQDDVTMTDADGRYTLPVTDDTIIFVTQPTGYTSPLDKNRLPRFYYIHKPAGSRQSHYAGVAPTGPLPKSVDFPLTRTPAPERFDIVVLADPQVETTQEIQYFRDDVLSELVGAPMPFGIVLGDLVSNQLGLFNSYIPALAQVGYPFYNVIGNHDMNFDAPDDRDSDETFHRYFGPNYYSWNYGRVHFVTLDTVEWMGRRYRGAIGDRQLNWLKQDLAHVDDDQLVVLCMHIPLWTASKRDCHDRDALFELLCDRRHLLALAGHTHRHVNTFFDKETGWHGPKPMHQLNVATVSGSWWSGPKDIRGIPVADNRDGVPNGYVIVSFNGNEYTARFKPASLDRDFQMRIYPPGSTGFDDNAHRRLLVNVFDGSDRCKVEYSMDHGDFQPMQQSPQYDPLSVALLSGVLDSGKPWARPYETPHMWEVKLPEPLKRGVHTVTIRVTDHYGRTFTRSRIFRR